MSQFVIDNGMKMIQGWPEAIAAAQTLSAYNIGGADFLRVRYGEEQEDWGANCGPLSRLRRH